MAKLYIACVLYNKSVEDIGTFENLIKFKASNKDISIMVLDNSSEEYRKSNAVLCQGKYKDMIEYCDNGGNIGLSKAYNIAISRVDEDDYWIMFIDDDTKFSLEYFSNVYECILSNREDVRIISGIITSGERVMSPMRSLKIFNKGEEHFISEVGVYDNIFCINSGLTLHSSVISKIGEYEERLFLDMIDHWLMERLIHMQCNRIMIVPGDIRQSFSSDEKGNKKGKIIRYKIFKKDFVAFCNLTGKSIFYKWFVLFKRRISLIIH